ncbi:MAG: glycosyltransferase [Bacteroidia bacterium]
MTLEALINDPYLRTLSIIGLSGFLVYVINLLIQFGSLTFFKSKHLESSNQLGPVSVIICAKNEDENLTEFLPKICSQNYPADYEVIVVNDCSYDETEHVIDEFVKVFPNLKKVTIKEDAYYKHGKKFAVLVGIKAATHNNLVFTDADCYPADENWLSDMAIGFTEKKDVVLGYGAYIKEKGLLNKLIRFDAFVIAAHFLSKAIKGKAYMGVGRNMAYKKDLFYKNKGFSKHYHINSGDDDLFVNQVANMENVNVAISHSAITYSVPRRTFKGWKLQKARHLTTAPFYNSSTKLSLSVNYLSICLFYLCLVPLCLNQLTLILLAAIILLKVIIQWLIMRKIAVKLNEPDLWMFSFIYELLLLLIYPIFHLAKIFYKPNNWGN